MSLDDRIIFHLDVDSFYVACELLRRPDLRGRPVAVTQYNSGGFVALSKEAKLAGLRKGDGIGKGGQQALKFFRNRPEATMEFVRLRCPNLVVLGMDTPYYRECSERIFNSLKSFSALCVVQQLSIDDFFVDATELVNNSSSSSEGKQEKVFTYVDYSDNIVSQPATSKMIQQMFGCRIAKAVNTAHKLRKHVEHQIGGVTLSCGISWNKLLSRLISKRKNLPDCQTLFFPTCNSDMDRLLENTHIQSVPTFKGKLGQFLSDALDVRTLLDVRKFGKTELEKSICEFFGCHIKSPTVVNKSSWLYYASRGQCNEAVVESSLKKSITTERSFPPCHLNTDIFKTQALNVCNSHLLRLREEKQKRMRTSTQISVLFRVGYGHSKSKQIKPLPPCIDTYSPEKLFTLMKSTIRGVINKDCSGGSDTGITRLAFTSTKFQSIRNVDPSLNAFFRSKASKQPLNSDNNRIQDHSCRKPNSNSSLNLMSTYPNRKRKPEHQTSIFEGDIDLSIYAELPKQIQDEAIQAHYNFNKSNSSSSVSKPDKKARMNNNKNVHGEKKRTIDSFFVKTRKSKK